MDAGTMLGARFRVIEALPHDIPGMERYAAHDTRLDRRTVVDVVDDAAADAVRSQATRAARLRDPRLARIVAQGRDELDGRTVTYVATEHVPGAVLGTVLAEHRVDPRRAIAIIGGAARALTAARSGDLSHGRLEAGAITVTDRGRVVVSGIGVDGVAAAQAGLVEPPSEQADVRALSRHLLHALTGVAPDEATADDLPDGVPAGARDVALAAVAGGGPDTLATLIAALSPFDARTLLGFTSDVAGLPPTPRIERERAEEAARQAARAEEERLARVEASRQLIAAETLDAARLEADEAVAETVADESLREAMHELDHVRADAVVEAEPEPETDPIPATPAVPAEAGGWHPVEEPADRYEAGFDTLEIMVADQNRVREPSTWELVLEALHRQWPGSTAVANSLRRARVRADSGGPLNGTRVVTVIAVVALGVAVALAFSWLSEPLSDNIIIEPEPSYDPFPDESPTSTPEASPNP